MPVEPEAEHRLREALQAGSLRAPEGGSSPERGPEGDPHFRTVPGLPHGARVVLRTDDGGRCVFLEAGRESQCAIHRQLGVGPLPAACRDFPRVVTLDPRSVSITLSHYCPTAAGLLFRHASRDFTDGRDPMLSIETNPPAFPSSWPYEGLDARTALAPLLRPGVLMGWEEHEHWETHAVSVLARENLRAEDAIDLLEAHAEDARGWTPSDGALATHLERTLGRPGRSARSPRPGLGECLSAWRAAVSCVPRPPPCPPPPFEPGEAARLEPLVDAGWVELARPIRRWLAAKAFASWLALQGEGLRTSVLGLRLALAVLRAEAARGCAQCGRTLDDGGLREAIRRSDLLLVHLVDPEALARWLSQGESGGTPTVAW